MRFIMDARRIPALRTALIPNINKEGAVCLSKREREKKKRNERIVVDAHAIMPLYDDRQAVIMDEIRIGITRPPSIVCFFCF